MALSDIKFKYLDKIQNIDNRIEKYSDIINNYNKRIEQAEKEETQNISSVLTAKSDYEKRVKNLIEVKKYYQEFVDTSDYLIQNINSKELPLLKSKYEQILNENQTLSDKNEELEILVSDTKEDLEKYKTMNENNKRKILNLKKDYDKRMDEIREYKSRIKAKDEAYSSLRDRKINEKTKLKTDTKIVKKDAKSQIRKLTAENKTLKYTNAFLERQNNDLVKKNEGLRDYCNELLNRKV